MSENTLPKGFEDLECWTQWCLDSQQERIAHRQASSFEDIKKFYVAMIERLDEILDYLSTFPMDDLPADAQRLFLLTLSVGEVAPAVELYRQVSVIDGYDVLRLRAKPLGAAADWTG